ncbi:MAG: type 1 glutamine amidotransferase [Alphaproteobacteria bacterium]|nr:type 1 glutamine amidotransferase [Alphaproteobacteria bacterium]
MKIGLLQSDNLPDEVRAKHGDYTEIFGRWLAEPAFDFERHLVIDDLFPERPDQCDAWLITGSPSGAYDDHDWIRRLEDFVRSVHAAGTPMVGICFGHQIMAQALGGKVEKSSGGWSIGVASYAIEGVGDSIPLIAMHQDHVVVPPPSASLVGSSSSCRYAALRYGDRGLSIQPHPEFTNEFLADLLDVVGDRLPASIVAAAAASLDQPTSADRVATYVKDFLKRAVALNAR